MSRGGAAEDRGGEEQLRGGGLDAPRARAAGAGASPGHVGRGHAPSAGRTSWARMSIVSRMAG